MLDAFNLFDPDSFPHIPGETLKEKLQYIDLKYEKSDKKCKKLMNLLKRMIRIRSNLIHENEKLVHRKCSLSIYQSNKIIDLESEIKRLNECRKKDSQEIKKWKDIARNIYYKSIKHEVKND